MGVQPHMRSGGRARSPIGDPLRLDAFHCLDRLGSEEERASGIPRVIEQIQPDISPDGGRIGLSSTGDRTDSEGLLGHIV